MEIYKESKCIHTFYYQKANISSKQVLSLLECVGVWEGTWPGHLKVHSKKGAFSLQNYVFVAQI